MIGIIDYGVANLGSIQNMLQKLGTASRLISSPAELSSIDKIILPGVGSFDYGMAALTEKGWTQSLKEKVQNDKVPILGICLGMQLLCKGSEEGAAAEGLGFIDGYCVRFKADDERKLRIPHMGWNEITYRGDNALIKNFNTQARFYFVHSYHMVCADPADVLATAVHGDVFTAIVHRGNVWGTQFHPEKSHRFGMALLNNFARM